MKPSDIREGVTYQNASGSRARRVISIGAPDAKAHFQDDVAVLFEHVRAEPRRQGTVDVISLHGFAAWADHEVQPLKVSF